MSSGKRNKPVVRKKAAVNGGGGPTAQETGLTGHGPDGDEASLESAADETEPDGAARASESGDEERAERSSDATPAISHIHELRPHEPDAEPQANGQELAENAADLAELEVEDSVAPPPAAPATRAHLKRVLESLIFVSDTIVSVVQLARLVKAKQAEVRELLAEITLDYEGRGIELIEVAGGYQFRSAAASAPFVRDLVSQRPVRLTRAQLETLALIAYRQPITRPEIDDVRGVDSGSAIKVLLERDLVKILGRKDEAGRPLLYGTAPYFLEFFSMKTMQDLPTLREFTELNQEHRELFKRKTGEIPDLSSEAETRPLAVNGEDDERVELLGAVAGDELGQQPPAADQAFESSDAASALSEEERAAFEAAEAQERALWAPTHGDEPDIDSVPSEDEPPALHADADADELDPVHDAHVHDVDAE